MSLQGAVCVEERVRRLREALRVEKEAHGRTRRELQELKEVLAGLCGTIPTVGSEADRGSPTLPFECPTPVEIIASDTVEATVSEQGGSSPTQWQTEEERASAIADRVRNLPRTRHPSILQTSPYVNPVRHVYKPRKRRTCGQREGEEEGRRSPPVQGEQGGEHPEERARTPPEAVGVDTVTHLECPPPCTTEADPAAGDDDVCTAAAEVRNSVHHLLNASYHVKPCAHHIFFQFICRGVTVSFHHLPQWRTMSVWRRVHPRQLRFAMLTPQGAAVTHRAVQEMRYCLSYSDNPGVP